jgi:hypothetical protein
VTLGHVSRQFSPASAPEGRARIDVALPEPPLAGEWEQARVEQDLANVCNALNYIPATNGQRHDRAAG